MTARTASARRSGLGELRAIVRLADVDGWRFTLAAVLGTASVLAAAGLMALSGYLICRAAQQPPILSLSVVIAGVRAVAFIRPASRYGERLSSHDVAFRALGRLRTSTFRRIEPLAPADLEEFRDGELLTRMVRDIDELQDLVLRVLLPVTIAVPTALVVIGGVALASPSAGAVLGLGLLLGAVVPAAVAYRVTAQARDRQAGLRSQLTADLVDALAAGPELWLNEADERTAARLADDDRALVEAARRDATGAGLADALGVAITGLTAVAVLATATAAAGHGTLNPLYVASLTLVAIASFEAVLPLSAAARHLPSVRSAGRRVLDLIEREPTVVDPTDPRELHEGLDGGDGHAPVPAIAVRGLVVSRGRGADRRVVLDGVDLALAPGDRLVVTGPSGAGKSTLLDVLVRFLDRDGGTVDLDGHDIRAYAQDDVRTRLLLLDQDPHVFHSDLRENVALARPGAADADITAALTRARLGDWLASLPDGLDTRVGQGGRSLSGGQRQRLAMARAFLADPAVLLLDEPTVHLDHATADALLADLWDAAGDRSVVLVTHGDPGAFSDCPRTKILPKG